MENQEYVKKMLKNLFEITKTQGERMNILSQRVDMLREELAKKGEE